MDARTLEDRPNDPVFDIVEAEQYPIHLQIDPPPTADRQGAIPDGTDAIDRIVCAL